MTEPRLIEDLSAEFADDPEYIAEGIAIGVLEDAIALMEAQGMTKAGLAERMRVSRAYVTKLFNAPPNLTLKTLAQLSLALGATPVVQLQPTAERANPTTNTVSRPVLRARPTSRARSAGSRPVPGG